MSMEEHRNASGTFRTLVAAGVIILGAAGSASAAPILLGADADTYLRDATPRGDFTFMDVRGGAVDFRGYLRFDLSGLTDPILDASLTLTVSGGASRNDAVTADRFALYGLLNAVGNTIQDWDEATFVPGAMGLEDVSTLTGVVDLDHDVAGMSELFSPFPAFAPGEKITISGAPLVAFLQSRRGDGGLATFILSNDDVVDRGFGLASREHGIAAFRPVLSITVQQPVTVPEPATLCLVGIGALVAAVRGRSARRRGAAAARDPSSGRRM
jgi:hypothetical protein